MACSDVHGLSAGQISHV